MTKKAGLQLLKFKHFLIFIGLGIIVITLLEAKSNGIGVLGMIFIIVLPTLWWTLYFVIRWILKDDS